MNRKYDYRMRDCRLAACILKMSIKAQLKIALLGLLHLTLKFLHTSLTPPPSSTSSPLTPLAYKFPQFLILFW